MKNRRALASLLMATAMLVSGIVPILAETTPATKKLKNVIVMISDGWGYNQIKATNFFTEGKEIAQAYEKFPTAVAMSTYSFVTESKDDDAISVYSSDLYKEFDLLKNHPTDSAAAGTAMATGIKSYDAAISVDQDKNILQSLPEDFKAMGRSTGVVSSVQFSHATPATFATHNINRNSYSEIGASMLKDEKIDLIMGAGNPEYDDNGKKKETLTDKDYRYVGDKALWEELKAGTVGNDVDGDGTDDKWKLIQTKEEFEQLTTGDTPKRVVGVPQIHTTLQQGRASENEGKEAVDQVAFNTNVPTLKTMTEGALNVLDNNDKGFFLMIEGGAVDWANHANQGGRMIEEQMDFNDSVNSVISWVEKNSSWDETLVIVTGDHETGYLTGTEGVYDDVKSNGQGNMPTMVFNSKDHTNQLVPLYAKGPGADMLKKLADEIDTLRGNYIDNTELSIAIRELVHWARPYVSFLESDKIVAGYQDGTFKPDNRISRAETATMLYNLLAKEGKLPESNADIRSELANQWYANQVDTVMDLQIMNGYPDGSFKADNKITRAEVASTIYNHLKKEGKITVNTTSKFNDVSDAWYAEAVNSLANGNFIAGYNDGSFKPESEITRAEVATMIAKVAGYQN